MAKYLVTGVAGFIGAAIAKWWFDSMGSWYWYSCMGRWI